MKIVVFTGEQPNQMALCHKISEQFGLTCIVLSKNKPRKPRRSVQLLWNRIQGHIVGRPFLSAWGSLQRRYLNRYKNFPEVAQISVGNINDPETFAAVENYAPDLVVVSGTNMLSARLIDAVSLTAPILNLHTGISPYVKGGPNCTNWCLAEKTLHLIGNTVMWIDPGIDCGPIIATEQTPLSGAESLDELHWKVMEHAHDLYVSVIRRFVDGKPVARVSQNTLPAGRTFYTNEWGGLAMWKARRTMRRLFHPEYFQGSEYRDLSESLQLLPMPRH